MDIFSHSLEYDSFKNDLCGRLIGAFVMLGKGDINYLLKVKEIFRACKSNK